MSDASPWDSRNHGGRVTDASRIEVTSRLDPDERSRLGQFMTPTVVADFMATLFTHWPRHIVLLDPGAGIGSLTEAFAERFRQCAPRGAVLEAHGYEIDPLLLTYLRRQMGDIAERIASSDRRFEGITHDRDFIAEASFLSSMGTPRFTHAILNPPYKKMAAASAHRQLTRAAGLETVNLYSAFLGLVVALMVEGGEVVAIVPRSFCNGTYFQPFRRFLLGRAAISHIHVFENRASTFRDDSVLQENIIVRLVRGADPRSVTLSFSRDTGLHDLVGRKAAFTEIVHPDDPHDFIRIPQAATDESRDGPFRHTLAQLGLTVSTGPVVDFRVRAHTLPYPSSDSVPLLYAHHFREGRLTWPIAHKKPNALMPGSQIHKALMPRGFYTLTRRFSAKEERRRIVAFVVDPADLPYPLYGFENHLNVFHAGKAGLPEDLARGLAVYLNSSMVDRAFRTFSGHTQVNDGDLRALRYPDRETLMTYGRWAKRSESPLTQGAIDACVGLRRD